MANEIKLTQTLDDRDVLAKMQKQLDMQDRQIAKMREASKASKDTGEAAEKSTRSMTQSFNHVQTAVQLVVDALNEAYEAQKRLQEEAKKYARDHEDLNKKFQNQSGLSGEKLAAALASQEATAIAAGVNIAHGKRAAIQLNSSGMSPEEASGAGLQAFLDVQAATNQVGEDPERQSKALLSYLASQGMAKTGANIEDVGSRIFTLFQGTNLQSSALDPLAKVASAFKGYMSSEEQFAVLSNAVENFSPEEAATGMRNMTMALTASKTEKSKVDALKALGLTPDQIDLQGDGENIVQSLRTLRGAVAQTEAKSPGMSDSYLAAFFGKELVPLAKQLMGNTDVIEKNIGLQGDRSKYLEAVGVGKSGINRAQDRLDAQEQLQIAPLYDRTDQILQQRDILEREAGTSEFWMRRSNRAYESLRGYGMDAEQAMRMTENNVPYDKIVKALEANTAATNGNTQATKTPQNMAPLSSQVGRRD